MAVQADSEALDVAIAGGELMEAYRRGTVGNRRVGCAEAVRVYAARLHREVNELIEAVEEQEKQTYMYGGSDVANMPASG